MIIVYSILCHQMQRMIEKDKFFWHISRGKKHRTIFCLLTFRASESGQPVLFLDLKDNKKVGDWVYLAHIGDIRQKAQKIQRTCTTVRVWNYPCVLRLRNEVLNRISENVQYYRQGIAFLKPIHCYFSHKLPRNPEKHYIWNIRNRNKTSAWVLYQSFCLIFSTIASSRSKKTT